MPGSRASIAMSLVIFLYAYTNNGYMNDENFSYYGGSIHP